MNSTTALLSIEVITRPPEDRAAIPTSMLPPQPGQ
jgi:hypothetical protein